MKQLLLKLTTFAVLSTFSFNSAYACPCYNANPVTYELLEAVDTEFYEVSPEEMQVISKGLFKNLKKKAKKKLKKYIKWASNPENTGDVKECAKKVKKLWKVVEWFTHVSGHDLRKMGEKAILKIEASIGHELTPHQRNQFRKFVNLVRGKPLDHKLEVEKLLNSKAPVSPTQPQPEFSPEMISGYLLIFGGFLVACLPFCEAVGGGMIVSGVTICTQAAIRENW